MAFRQSGRAVWLDEDASCLNLNLLMENNNLFDRVVAVYFSATLTTKRVVAAIAGPLAAELHAPYAEIDITTPESRTRFSFGCRDVVVLGMPVYIGRVPNLIAPFLRQLSGGGAVGVPVVVFGNRAYDDALGELRDIMVEGGFCVAAAAAFVGEHSFSRRLGAGRPDDSDLAEAGEFARGVAGMIGVAGGEAPLRFAPMGLPGNPAPYRFFQAKTEQGDAVDIRRVTPVTDTALCARCGLCARICSMGAISHDDPALVTGRCIKCSACVKRCPCGAKSFRDPVFLSHLSQLEASYGRRAANEVFFADLL